MEMNSQAARSSRRSDWLYRVAALLAALVLISTYLLSGLSAKFLSSDYGQDDARTASFDIYRAGDLSSPITVTGLHPNMTNIEKTITITNHSEETVNVTITATNKYSNMPFTMSWKNTTGSPSFQLAPNSTAVTYTLVLSWAGNWDESTYTTGTSSPDYAGLVDEIDIDVKAEQAIAALS